MAISEQDLVHLRSAVALAREAYDAGDQPFGTVLVAGDGSVLWSGRNHAGGGDETQHPELAVAQWSARLSPEERARCTVYTSGEHCPMCAAAHAWVGLDRIVYATSSAQLSQWLREWGAPPSPVAPLPITTVAPLLTVEGPAPQFTEPMKALYEAKFRS